MSYKTYENYKDSGIEWIGEIPKEWSSIAFKYTFYNTNGGEVIDKNWWNEGSEILYTCQKTPLLSFYNNFPKNKRTEKGDLLLTRNATPYVFIPKENAIYTNVVQRIKVKEDDYDLRYLAYSLQQAADAYGVASGISIPSYNMDIWSNLTIPLLDKTTQIKIANYLDSKLSEIDNNISKNKELISLLEEKKVALINQCVTKGLNPNVPMKDSGIEWIGEIPEHWDIRPFKKLVNLIGGGTPSTDKLEYWGGDIPWISIKDFNNDSKHIEVTEKSITSLGLENSSTKILEKGDLIISDRGTVGEIGIIKLPMAFNQSCYGIRTLNCIDSEFFYYFLKYSVRVLKSNTYGSVFDTITTDTFDNIIVNLPPLDEQEEIAIYLDNEFNKIDIIKNKVQSQIDLLEEHKQSLIYHVVTGKVDVSGVEV